MSESRQEFLDRVDGTCTKYEQALFIALSHLALVADGVGNPRRIASQCLESIDARLRLER